MVVGSPPPPVPAILPETTRTCSGTVFGSRLPDFDVIAGMPDVASLTSSPEARATTVSPETFAMTVSPLTFTTEKPLKMPTATALGIPDW